MLIDVIRHKSERVCVYIKSIKDYVVGVGSERGEGGKREGEGKKGEEEEAGIRGDRRRGKEENSGEVGDDRKRQEEMEEWGEGKKERGVIGGEGRKRKRER